MKSFTRLIGAALVCAALVPAGAARASTVVVVKPSAMNGWAIVDDTTGGGVGGSFVNGPGSPPAGVGSGRLQLATAGAGWYFGGGASYAGTPLADLTSLQYSTYRSSIDAGNNLAIALQINVDYDLTDASIGWQGRIVFEPYNTFPGGVPQNTWQGWNALAGKWWQSGNAIVGNSNVGKACPQSSPCNWSTLTAAYPNAGFHATFGAIVLKAGSNWAGFDGNVDYVTIGVSGTDTTYDFEPETACTTTCYVNAVTGNDLYGGDTPATAKKTIQAAVTQVSPSGTVIVAAGTYAEDVAVPKSVTIKGANFGTNPNTPAWAAAARAPESVVQGYFSIAAPDVTVDGFEFTTPSANASIKMAGGVGISLDNITVANNLFTNVKSAAFGLGIGYGTGGKTDGTMSGLSITNNRVNGFGYLNTGQITAFALVLAVGEDLPDGAVISGNYIKGGVSTGLGDRGINLDGTRNVTISGNYLTTLVETSGNGGGWGIQILHDTNTVVSGNTLRDMFVGIQVLSGGNPSDIVTVSNIAVRNNNLGGLRGIALYLTAASCTSSVVGCLSPFNGVVVEDNVVNTNVGLLKANFASIDVRHTALPNGGTHNVTIQRNTVNVAGTYGTAISTHAIKVRGNVGTLNILDNVLTNAAAGGLGGPGEPANSGVFLLTTPYVANTVSAPIPATASITIRKNQISGFRDGVITFEATASNYGGLPVGANVDANRNALLTSANGIRNDPSASETIDGTCNWWGAANGPSGVGPGAGSAVGPNVTFSPWLITSNLNGVCNGGTARGNKQVVLASLAPMSGNKNVAKAIEHINRSLTPAYWADDDHLTAKGKKVFEDEKKAVAELMKVTPVPQAAIDGLVAVDQALAQTAIDEVSCGGAPKCLAELAKANASMAKADDDLAAGDYDKAIEDYKKAWEFAMKAMDFAVEPEE